MQVSTILAQAVDEISTAVLTEIVGTSGALTRQLRLYTVDGKLHYTLTLNATAASALTPVLPSKFLEPSPPT